MRFDTRSMGSALARHMDVARVAVETSPDSEDAHDMVAFVVPSERVLQRVRRSTRERRLGEWRMVYGSVYEDQTDPMGFGENFAEWTSSYDRRPIDRVQMEEWRSRTVDTILSLRPRKVLEIGAGSGLILSRVAPRCESYWATDLSEEAVRILAGAVGRDPGLTDVVEVRHQPAHDFEGLPTGLFDTVVLNSVVQYFPDSDYLLDVLEGVLTALAPGGTILLGDIRNRRSLRCLYTAAELQGADGGTPVERIREGAEERLLRERELLLEPGFFASLPRVLDTVSAVDVRLKRGEHHNELTRHRYDVLLYTRPVEGLPLDGAVRLDWGSRIRDERTLTAYLTEHRPSVLRLDGVPDARLAGELGALRALEEGRPLTSVIDTLHGEAPTGALDPETCHEVGAHFGYEVRATCSVREEGCFDVVLVSDVPSETPLTLCPPATTAATRGGDTTLLNGESVTAFEKALRAHLARVFENIPLPKTKFVITEELPCDRN
ncbi:class I SAM-dependent methyltransferase [Nocardiopsis sp. NPDC049922]|uniref:class I SAM-dependent methyltransferase n=1 Tax=Nocardiopsis sp. NPDC049922 TaxID=3155157 RepID=UPI00340B3970